MSPSRRPVTCMRTVEWKSDLPFWRQTERFAAESPCILLDSALAVAPLGRYSFLGGNPAAVLTGRFPAGTVTASGGGGPGRPLALELARRRLPDGEAAEPTAVRRWSGDPFAALRDLAAEYRPAIDTVGEPTFVGPFYGGLAGYFGYEAGRCLEDLPGAAADDLGLPVLAFLVLDEVLAHDHRTGRTTLTVTGRGADMGAARRDAEAVIERWARTEPTGPAPIEPAAGSEPSPFRARFDRERYCAAVQRCREHILAGDAFEICLTHRLETDRPGSPWDLYATLRRDNPAPFASWLQFPDFQILSASPERFLRLNAERIAESRPIKGTRPRGADPAADRRLREELAVSTKDRAENLMIVDLVRSDLGRVAEVGSVEVPELLQVETYATVHQLVSTIRARLREDLDGLDLVRACFPGGSMTGAPKIEAMKIIDSLEPVVRGVYSGAIGYVDYSGVMDFSIVIRTIVCRDDRCTFGVGGAVVADSDPDAEYQETLDKARALLAAIGKVRERGRP